MNRRTAVALLFTLLPMVSLFCSGGSESGSPDSTENSLGRTDSRGKQVRLERVPERIVSLGPNITETLFALNRGELLVGRTDYCNYPEQAANIPSVGTLREPNLEFIIDLEPDLVLASTHVSEEILNTLEGLNIPTALFYGPEDFSGLEEVILGCAALTEAEQEGTILLEEIEGRREAVRTAASKSTNPRVYYALGFGDGGDWTAGKGTFIDRMIDWAGGENIVENEGWSYSKEMLIEQDPDLIIVGLGKREAFLALPIYGELRAARAGRVYEVDENILVRQGPRLIEGLETLADLFADLPEGSHD
ncbi:MAG: ABC transporter substrate-binding protein [Spirochaetales bacterium]|nr:ABC transporter substrate-binding protein [Spirochaetales bacterium]